MRYVGILLSMGISLLAVNAGGGIPKEPGDGRTMRNREPVRRVLLLGASVGRHWDFPGLSRRLDVSKYIFEYRHGGGFDKTRRLAEVLARTEDKPDAVLLKQCAAYFPRNPEETREKMREWVASCRAEGVVPIPTTVVPVTRLNAFKQFLIDILKRRNPFRFGNPFAFRRNQAILAYNDWILSFCREQRLVCLDLEASLVYSGKNRFLRENLARIDGLHLNHKAYLLLDQIISPTLEKVDWIEEDSFGGMPCHD